MVAPLNPQQLAYQKAGYTGGFGAGEAGAWVRQQNPSVREDIRANSGITGAGVALQDPLHAWEKEGLTGLSDTSGLDRGAQSGALQQLQALMAQITSPVSAESIQAGANPHAEALKGNLSRDAEKLRAAATAGQGMRGGRSFGDTSTGARLGEIDAQELATGNELDYKTWMDSQAQRNTERQLAGSSGLAGASKMFDFGTGLRQSGVTDLQNKLGAGSYVRGFNQNQNDIMLNDIMAGQEYDTKNIGDILSLLKNYQSNTSSGQTGGMASGLTQAGGAASSIGGILQDLTKNSSFSNLYNSNLGSGFGF